MLPGTVLKPSPHMRRCRTSRFPFSWHVQWGIADVRDSVFQSDLLSSPVAAPFRGDEERNLIRGNKSVLLREQRRREKDAVGESK